MIERGKVQRQKLIVFLYIGRTQLENKISKTIPFTTAQKTLNFLVKFNKRRARPFQ